MKIDLRLTPRDKILLALLASVLVLLLLVNFIVNPLMNRNQILKGELMKVEDKVNQMNLAIANANDMALQLEKAQEKVASYQDLLPEPMSADQMDQVITSLLLQYGLKAKDLILFEITDNPIESFRLSETTRAPLKGVLSSAEVSFLCEGTTRSFYNMVRGMEQNHKYIRIIDYSFDFELSNSATFNLDSLNTIQGTLLVYMFRK